MPTTTYNAKPGELERHWYIVDADGETLGRLATRLADTLRGKRKPQYTPHVDTGDFVVVINCERIRVTGKKLTDKIYYRHTGHPGGIKQRSAGQVLDGKFPERVLEKAVERMLPKESPLARAQMTHLRLYNSPEHPHEAQTPETIAFKEMNAKNVRSA